MWAHGLTRRISQHLRRIHIEGRVVLAAHQCELELGSDGLLAGMVYARRAAQQPSLNPGILSGKKRPSVTCEQRRSIEQKSPPILEDGFR
jgi:hypothetical protein